MTVRTRKCRLLHTVFLSYFLLFSISTISYRPIYEQINKTVEEPGGADMTVPRLSLLELIGLIITHQTDSGSSNSACRFLVLKKRAVLPTENVIRKAQVRDFAPVIHSVTLSEGISRNLPASDKGRLQHKWLLFVHSGVSPPVS